MYKVIDNVKILMTAEELAELEAMGQAQPPISPTEAERLSALEAAMLELMMGDRRWLSLSASSIVWAV